MSNNNPLCYSGFSSRNSMIRLNVYCSLVSCPTKKVKDHVGGLIRFNRQKWNVSSPRRIITSMALKDEMDGRFSNLPGQSWEPGLETAVPFEQRPVFFQTINKQTSITFSYLYILLHVAYILRCWLVGGYELGE